MKYKNIICVVTNCIVYFAFLSTDLSTALLRKYQVPFLWDVITIIIVSSVFSFIGRKNIKEKLMDFIKMCIVSYISIIIIGAICFIHVMSRFD